eukprot:12920310-Prorocentrum_lima.AAC.1
MAEERLQPGAQLRRVARQVRWGSALLLLPLLTSLGAVRQWLFVKEGESPLQMSPVSCDVATLRMWYKEGASKCPGCAFSKWMTCTFCAPR